MMVADLAQGLQKSRQRGDAVHIAGDRFDDDAGDLRADLVEGFPHLCTVVVVQGDGVLRQGGGYPGEEGSPRVSMPEPAFTSRESEWPW